MDHQILGPLALVDHGEPVRVPGGRQTELIGLLLTFAGQALTTDRLIDALWPGGLDAPSNPLNALQQRILQVRRLLDPDGTGEVLVTVRSGYVLQVDDHDIDARRFERLAGDAHRSAEAGDGSAAAEHFEAALELWRGELLEGLDAAWVLPERARLGEIHLQAIEGRADALLALGNVRRVVTDLEPLVHEHPLREGLRRRLMLALAYAGRPADALQLYEDGRRELADALGVDPSPQLRALHLDILHQRVPPTSADPDRLTTPGAPRPDASLPRATSTFVGRDQELARLRELLASERCITVVGPGGAGKTRLAIETARAATDQGRTRPVHLVELAAIVDAEAIASTFATALGAPLTSNEAGRSVADLLAQTLTGHRALLVVDNCEHLVEAAASLLGFLLARCPELQVLATSREPLGIDGEIVWTVPMLGLPDDEVTCVADALAAPAVELFCARAREADPSFALTDEDVRTVCTLVRQLDGLPLALELAAARLRAFSLEEIRARLDDRFRLLSKGRRTADRRHRTLWDTLDWSWELLDDACRDAWMAAAVPAAPFDAELLVPLLGVLNDEHVDEAIAELCDHSLLAVHERGPTSRYRMLETIREYGRTRLSDTDAGHTLFAAHADTVEAAVERAIQIDDHRWAVDFDLQRAWLPEARAAIRWRLAHDDARGAQRLIARLGWLWYLTALAAEGLRFLDEALGPLHGVDIAAADPEAVLWASILRVNQAPQDDGLGWAEAAVQAMADDPVSREVAEVFVANHLAVAGQLDAALAMTRDASPPTGWLAGLWRLVESQILAIQGRTDEGSQLLTQAERLLVDNGAWWGVWATASLVQLAQLRGNLDSARATATRALTVCEERNIAELEVEIRGLLAMVEATADDHRAAEVHLDRAQQLAEETSLAISEALVANSRGYASLRRERLDAARVAFNTALALHARAGQPFGRPFSLWGLGHVELADGNVDAARQLHLRAVQAAMERGDGDAVARTLEGLAAACTSRELATTGARLLGAATIRRGRMGAPRPIIAHDEAHATELALRELLGTDHFERERAIGYELTADELDMTLRSLPAPLSPAAPQPG